MSRVSDLEKKVDALERNVGMLAKTALVINGTPIHEHDGTAIYDLHIPTTSFMGKTYLGCDARSMTVLDIKKFFKDNYDFVKEFKIVQDINHMSDIYLIP